MCAMSRSPLISAIDGQLLKILLETHPDIPNTSKCNCIPWMYSNRSSRIFLHNRTTVRSNGAESSTNGEKTRDGSGVCDSSQDLRRVVKRVVKRVRIGTAALCKVRRAATAAADATGEFADDFTGVDIDAIGH